MNLSTFRKSFMMVTLALLTSVVMWGCGSDSYTDHTAQVLTKTETPLISAEQLKAWYDADLVNSDGNENVVILHVDVTDTNGDFINPTIPGAYFWDAGTELSMTRLEGLGNAGSSVITGPMMDAILQRSGVNKYSTIVITGADSSWRPERAYFTLRYWGFPKERIKFLNGGVAGWTAAVTENSWDQAIYGVTTKRPAEHTGNSFSVRENYQLRDDLRYSLGEMILAVEDNLAGKRFNILHNTTATDATLKTAVVRSAGAMEEGGYYKSAADIITTIKGTETAENNGYFVEGLPNITHCASGMSCSPIFFALDAILGWEVAIFDGSTNLWNAYLDKPEGSTLLAPNAAWNTTELTNPAVALTTTTDIIDPILNSRYLSADDPRANQIENEDNEYMATPPSAPTNVGTGDASGC